MGMLSQPALTSVFTSFHATFSCSNVSSGTGKVFSSTSDRQGDTFSSFSSDGQRGTSPLSLAGGQEDRFSSSTSDGQQVASASSSHRRIAAAFVPRPTSFSS